MPTILITGSEGNIGRYLVERLRQTRPDYKIIRLKHKTENETSGRDIIYAGDLTEAAFAGKIFKENNIDYVIHAAAKSYNAAGFAAEVYSLISNDTQSLLNVLNNCQKIKKFVYLSSSVVYESGDQPFFNEELTEKIPAPKSPIGLAKFFGEQAVKFFNQQFGLSYTIWRPFNVVSPRESHQGKSGHVFIDFYRKLFIERAPKIEIFGDGRQVRCFIWMEDAANAIVDFLDDRRTDNQILNLGSNQPKSLIELINLLLQIGKEKNLLPADYNPEISTGAKFFGSEAQKRLPSTEKIKSLLGWTSQTDFKECFDKFIEYKAKK